MLRTSGGGDGVFLIREGCILSDGGKGTNWLVASMGERVAAEVS